MANLTASPNNESPYVLEGKLIVREGEVHAHTLSWPFWSSVSTAGTEVYVNGSSQTTAWLGGSTSVSGNVTTLSSLTVPAGLGGSTAVVEVSGVNGGETRVMGVIHIVIKPGQTP
jgi:hypothetical protein